MPAIGAKDARGGTLSLRDRRTLGYAEWGSSDGRPVIYMHGGLGSRLERQLEDEGYEDLGVRLITVDRPGHGLSSPQPGRRPLDFADDAEQLVDHLGLDQVEIVGHSAGGVYVLAMALRMPQRLRNASIVSGLGIIARPDGIALGLVPRFERTYRNAREKAWRARAEMRINIAAFRYAPGYAFKQLSDRRVTTDPVFQRHFREALLEGARQGPAAFVSDIATNTGPWGFEPAEIGLAINWWHGDRDSASPLAHARHVVEQLPRGELEVVPGGGHFMIHTEIRKILEQSP